jgi:hypothetical protein
MFYLSVLQVYQKPCSAKVSGFSTPMYNNITVPSYNVKVFYIRVFYGIILFYRFSINLTYMSYNYVLLCYTQVIK